MPFDNSHAGVSYRTLGDIRLAILDCAEGYEGRVVTLTPLFNLRQATNGP